MSKHHEQQSRSAPGVCLVTHTALRIVQLLEPCLHRTTVQKPMCSSGKLKVSRKEAFSLKARRENKKPSVLKFWEWQVSKCKNGSLKRRRRALLLQLPLDSQQK